MLLFMDGQAHYDTAGIGLKYSALTSTSADWSVTAEGRFGNCIKRVAKSNSATGVGAYLDIAPLMTRANVWTPTNSGVCGFAIKIDKLALNAPNENGPASNGCLFAIMEGENWPLKVILTPSGTFGLVQAWSAFDNYGAVMAISSEGLQDGAWAFVEFKWIIHGSAGLFEIRVNTVPVLTYTGDTVSHNPFWHSNQLWNAVRLLHCNAALGPPWLTVRICDLYLADLTAVDSDDIDDYLGDGTIETIMPNAPGASTGWTPSAVGGDNWDMTNDRPASDGDGTYVTTTAAGTQDSYHFEDVPSGSEIKAVHWNLLARKVEEGSVVVAPLYHEGTDFVGPSQGVASTVYDRYLTQPYDINPATGAPWTAAEVNAGIWGVKKVL